MVAGLFAAAVIVLLVTVIYKRKKDKYLVNHEQKILERHLQMRRDRRRMTESIINIPIFNGSKNDAINGISRYRRTFSFQEMQDREERRRLLEKDVNISECSECEAFTAKENSGRRRTFSC